MTVKLASLTGVGRACRRSIGAKHGGLELYIKSQSQKTDETRLPQSLRDTHRDTLAFPMVYFQGLTVPSVLFHVVESTCIPLTVTAEVASSSLVVPAIHSKAVKSEWKTPIVPCDMVLTSTILIALA